jgi:enoyl-CoA hydratase/carnithine racemase
MEFWNDLLKVRKPVFAAITGDCHGGGLELALACDIVYAETSSTFALPGIRIGLMPGCGGTQRLTRRVGKARAMEMILLGDSCAPSSRLRLLSTARARSMQARRFSGWAGGRAFVQSVRQAGRPDVPRPQSQSSRDAPHWELP